MAFQMIPESVDGKLTGRTLRLNENGEEVDPVTESVVVSQPAVVLEVEAPRAETLLDALSDDVSHPAADEVASPSEE